MERPLGRGLRDLTARRTTSTTMRIATLFAATLALAVYGNPVPAPTITTGPPPTLVPCGPLPPELSNCQWALPWCALACPP